MESKKPTVKKLIRHTLITIVLCNVLYAIYGLTFASYFSNLDKVAYVEELKIELIAEGYAVKEVEIGSYGFIAVFDVTQPVDRRQLRKRVEVALCKFALIEDSLNINLRFSSDVRFENSGEALGNWQAYERNCT